jgi:hypothetical protein
MCPHKSRRSHSPKHAQDTLRPDTPSRVNAAKKSNSRLLGQRYNLIHRLYPCIPFTRGSTVHVHNKLSQRYRRPTRVLFHKLKAFLRLDSHRSEGNGEPLSDRGRCWLMSLETQG